MMQQLDTHIYYDLSVINNNDNFEKIPMLLKEVRQLPYVMNPSAYYVTIARFNLDTGDLPVWIPEIEKGQADVNKTIYNVSFDNGTTFTYLEWLTQDDSAPSPQSPLSQQDVLSEYYFCKSYAHFLTILNTAVKNSWIAGGNALPCPFFSLDSATLNLKYHYPTTGTFDLVVNQSLYNLLITFNFKKMTGGKRYKLQHTTSQELQTISAPFDNQGTFYVLWTDTTPLSQLNPISSLVFQTIEMPLVPTNVSPTEQFFGRVSNSSASQKGGQNGNIAPIITDFIVPFGPNNTYKPFVYYVPTAEYRLLDLKNTEPISSIQVLISWKDKWGNLHTMYLDSGCGASMKLLFRLRDF